MSGRALARFTSLLPVTATCTPSATNAVAMANPIPRDPPVPSATFPFKALSAIQLLSATFDVPDTTAARIGDVPELYLGRLRHGSEIRIQGVREVAVLGAGPLGGAIADALAR